MGCGGSAGGEKFAPPPVKSNDVCITSTSAVLSAEDFASFFSIWITKVCTELKLSAKSGRPQLGPNNPKPGSRDERSLQSAVLCSRVVICIVNISVGEEMPPIGYKAEMSWAQQSNIPVVPFYDADRFTWKEVCAWKMDMPWIFRSGIGPVRYHRKAHEEAKQNLSAAIKKALSWKDPRRRRSEDSDSEASESGALFTDAELSKSERQLYKRGFAPKTRTAKEKEKEKEKEAEDDGGEFLGLFRGDFERAGLVEKKLERSNSLKDINLEVSLSLLAKQAKGDGGGFDMLAPRDGGVRLQFADGVIPNEKAVIMREPAHKILVPTKGILKSKDKKFGPGRRVGVEAPKVKQLRLAPHGGGGTTEERRLHFAIQQLQQHLDALQVDDVHELVTVVRCLKDGADDNGLATRAIRLLGAFLQKHASLQARAVQQGAIPAITQAMRQHPAIDMNCSGYSALIAILEGSSGLEQVGDDVKDQDIPPGMAGYVALMARSGAPEVVTTGMRIFPACELLQEKGCKLLGILCKDGDDNRVSSGYKKGKKAESNVMLRSQCRRLVARHGGVPLLYQAMKRYPVNAELQVGGCMALGQLGSTEVRIKRKAASGGVVGLLFTTMDKHPQHVQAQRWACAALRHLSSNSNENKTFIARHGGVERLCEAGRRFLGVDSQVVTEALGCLCHLASKHPQNKQRIFEVGALELTMEALYGEPETEMAMACCGLLHNLSCDPDIKRHVVKLGGRETAERLSRHEASAVRNLAQVLNRTLSPPKEQVSGGDPFGAIFATRTPGAAHRRVASKRDRKKAQAALVGAGAGIGGEDAPKAKPARGGGEPARGEDDAKSESGESQVSATSKTSNNSSGSHYSGGVKRKPGQSKMKTGARRFASTWDSDGATEGAEDDHSSAGGAGGEWDDAASVVSAGSGRSQLSFTSHMSLDANEHLDEALQAQLGFVKVRTEAAPAQPSTMSPSRRAKQRAKESPAAAAPEAARELTSYDGPKPAAYGVDAVLLEERRPPEAEPDAPAKSASFTERFRNTVGNIEQVATRKLDRAGQAARQKASGRPRSEQ